MRRNKLTERDFSRIVNRVINESDIRHLVGRVLEEQKEIRELNKSTWRNIAKNVKDRGYDEFSSRIEKHGRDFGIGGDEFIFDFVTERGNEMSGEFDHEPKFHHNWKNYDTEVTDDFMIKITQHDEGMKSKTIEGIVVYPRSGNDVKLSLFTDGGNTPIKASNRKSAMNLINYLTENGIKIPNKFRIDWRSFTEGY